LHLGHARTFVLAWAHVRSRGGQLRLRLEDLDASRCRPELMSGVLEDLEWLGLDWDGPALLQSKGLDHVREVARSLWLAGHAYECFCSRADLKQAASAPQRGVEELRYPGTCRPVGSRPVVDADRPSALRFRVPEGSVSFCDGILGPQSFDVDASVGDFVISNRARHPSYQLAVVVDDAAQGVTEVFRGDDLLASTARQILIQQALELPAPAWFHVPLVLDESGRRLAKRADDLSLASLRESGADARAILGWIAASSGFQLDERPQISDLCDTFDLARLCREPVTLSHDAISNLRCAR
jgi:glutamyl-tRNA synthetase